MKQDDQRWKTIYGEWSYRLVKSIKESIAEPA